MYRYIHIDLYIYIYMLWIRSCLAQDTLALSSRTVSWLSPPRPMALASMACLGRNCMEPSRPSCMEFAALLEELFPYVEPIGEETPGGEDADFTALLDSIFADVDEDDVVQSGVRQDRVVQSVVRQDRVKTLPWAERRESTRQKRVRQNRGKKPFVEKSLQQDRVKKPFVEESARQKRVKKPVVETSARTNRVKTRYPKCIGFWPTPYPPTYIFLTPKQPKLPKPDPLVRKMARKAKKAAQAAKKAALAASKKRLVQNRKTFPRASKHPKLNRARWACLPLCEW